MNSAPRPEYGNYYDNLQALELALIRQRHGELEDSLLILEELKAQILQHTGERKSLIWLLPQVEAALAFGQSPEITA